MKKIFLTSFIALGLIACNDSDETTIDNGTIQAGDTYASVSVSLKSQATRLTDSQEDNAGTVAEQKMNDLLIISSKAPDMSFNDSEIIPGFAAQSYTTKPWKTTSGLQDLALIFNKNSVNAGGVSETATRVHAGSPTSLTSPFFTMTSAKFDADVIKGITEAQATTGTGVAQNVFSTTVERVVAKGIVRKHAEFSSDVKDAKGDVVATVSKLKFAAVNGAKRTFLYGDNAGSRALNTTSLKYDNFTSAIHNIAPQKDATAAENAGLVRLGLESDTEVSTAKEVNAEGALAEDANTKTFYFLENSGDPSKAVKDLGYYRFAYAKVYATYVPKSLLEIDDTKPAELIERVGTGKYYKPKAEGGYEVAQQGEVGAKEGLLVWALKTISGENRVDEAGDPVYTFYKGATDGILYASEAAAISSKNAPLQGIYVYKDGRCGYRTLWNRQESAPNVVANADARRNNTYLLSVKTFGKLGFPWDESDPNDPNLPKVTPETPTLPEPEDPTDPSIEPEETFMRVEAEVLPWNVVIRDDVELH